MKSYSVITKKELSKKFNDFICCDLAEFAGMLLFGSEFKNNAITFVTENEDVLNRYLYLAEKCGVKTIQRKTTARTVRYFSVIDNIDDISEKLEFLDSATNLMRYKISPFIIERDCCRRAFVRGSFMGGGTVIDPNKNYNLELITPYLGLSNDMLALLKDEGFEFKTVIRKSKYVIYTKKSETIEDFLTYIGAFTAQMNLINVKIEKEVRNGYIRTINGENANYDKTIQASIKQIQAIEIIKNNNKMDILSPELQEICDLRIKYKDVSLTALGQLLDPPLGKSGVNHRLKKITEIAEKIENGEL